MTKNLHKNCKNLIEENLITLYDYLRIEKDQITWYRICKKFFKGDENSNEKNYEKISCVTLATITATSLLQGSMKEVFLADEVVSVKTSGYENGKGLDLNKLGSYITGSSNKDGGVSEIISYANKNNKAWVVNGATGMIDMIDLSNITSVTSSEMLATSIDIKAIVEGKTEGFTYGDMTSVSVHAESGYVAIALQDEAYDKNGYVAILKTDGM